MRLLPLWLFVYLAVADGQTPANWNANHPPCNRHSELLKQGHMDLGVRVATANPVLAEQFRRAMDTWAEVLDLDWHEDDTQNCSIILVDGQRELFGAATLPQDRSYRIGSISRAALRSIRRRRSARPNCTGYRCTRSATYSDCSIVRAQCR